MLKLAKYLKDYQITDLFFHVGPLDSLGKISSSKYSYAEDLVNILKSYSNTFHIQAWIGQVEVRGGGILDLSSSSVRNEIVNTAKDFLDIGFDGIHYNIEPITSGSEDYLDLLYMTKKLTKERNCILSIASDELVSNLFYIMYGIITNAFQNQSGFWKEEYYLQVSENVDQIAVMTYDTAMPTDWLYGSIVEWETKSLVKLLRKNITIFFGLPTYKEKKWNHNPDAENISIAIKGVKKGLENISTDDIQNVGIALYSFWTTSEDEWEIFKNEWLNIK